MIAKRVTNMVTEKYTEPVNSIAKLVKVFLSLGYINNDQRGGLVERAWTILQEDGAVSLQSLIRFGLALENIDNNMNVSKEFKSFKDCQRARTKQNRA